MTNGKRERMCEREREKQGGWGRGTELSETDNPMSPDRFILITHRQPDLPPRLLKVIILRLKNAGMKRH